MGRGVTDDPTWTKRFLQELAYHLAPLVDGSIAPEDEISIAQAFSSNQPHCFCARKEQQWRQRIGALKCIGYGRCVRSARQQSGVRTSACEWQRKCRSAGTSSLLPTLERTGHGYIYMTHYWTLCTRCSPLRARRGTPTEGLQSQISRLNAPIHGVAKQWQGVC